MLCVVDVCVEGDSSRDVAGYEHPLTLLISQRNKERVSKSVSDLVDEDEEAALQGMSAALQKLAPEKRRAMLEKLLA